VAFDLARSRGSTEPGFGRRLSIALERTLDAPMERVWAVLRDYAQARPRILTEHFSDYVIHEGGQGVLTDSQDGDVDDTQDGDEGRCTTKRPKSWGRRTKERKRVACDVATEVEEGSPRGS